MGKSEVPAVQERGAGFLILAKDVNIKEVMEANIGPRGVQTFDFDRVKLPTAGGAVWSIPALDGEKQIPAIAAIVVGWQDVRAYWSGTFTGAQPPQCASLDCATGIGDPGGVCEKCPYGQFGSAQGGEGAGQACKTMRRLLLIQEGAILPMMLTLPPTSLKSCRQYFLRLAAAQVPYYGAVTSIRLEKAQNVKGMAYSRAVFTVSRLLTADETATARWYTESMAGAMRGPVANDECAVAE